MATTRTGPSGKISRCTRHSVPTNVRPVMTRRTPWTLAALALLLAGGVSPLRAQPGFPLQPGGVGMAPRPAFSPYLNLLRQGGTPTLNYFGLVRPQMQANQAIANLQG